MAEYRHLGSCTSLMPVMLAFILGNLRSCVRFRKSQLLFRSRWQTILPFSSRFSMSGDFLWCTKNQDGGKVDFINPRCVGRRKAALGSWRKLCRVFGCSSATFTGSSGMHLGMPYIECPQKRGYPVRLLSLLVTLRVGTKLSDQLKVYTVLDRPCDALNFLEKFWRWDATAAWGVKWGQLIDPRSRLGWRWDVRSSVCFSVFSLRVGF